MFRYQSFGVFNSFTFSSGFNDHDKIEIIAYWLPFKFCLSKKFTIQNILRILPLLHFVKKSSEENTSIEMYFLLYLP